MKKMKRMALTALLAIFLAAAACGAPAPSQVTPAPAPEQTEAKPSAAEPAESASAAAGSPWIDTSILGNLPGQAPDPKDDLFTAYGYEWMSTHTDVPDGYVKYGVREQVDQANQDKLRELMQDESQSSHEAELVRTVYQSALDMDARNEAGLEPLAPYIQKVLEIETIDELTEYLCDSEYNLSVPLFTPQPMINPYNTEEYMLVIVPLGEDYEILGEKEQASDSIFAPVMKRLGIAEDEITAMNAGASALVTELNAVLTDLGEVGSSSAPVRYAAMVNPYTVEEMEAIASRYPIAEIIEAKGYDKVPSISLLSPNWLKRLDELYVQENLAGFKGMLIHHMIVTMAPYLDEETVAWSDELYLAANGSLPPSASEDKAFAVCDAVLSTPMGKLLVDNCLSEETEAEVREMVEEIRAVLRGRLEHADWVTDITRERALEKLDSIQVRVGGGDKWRDYSALSLPDGVLAEQVIAVCAYNDKLQREEIAKPVDPDYWPMGISRKEYSVAAFYHPSENSINILAGILQEPFYYAEGTMEQRYFAVGTIIGHELTHAFDPGGSYFDKDGNLKDWWEEEDRENFDKLQQEVKALFGSIEVKPGEYVDSENCIGEITADLAGLSLILEVAAGHEGVDYQLAFQTYAEMWPEVMSTDAASALLKSDVHPPKYVRVNAIAQQFEEFYSAYGVKEGDGMYLAPEKRVVIW